MKISIITVNRNDAAGLRKTILSVAAQTAKPWQFIVIDGASDDGSAELLKEYGESISYSVSEPDKGIYDAMNKGIAQADGDYCLFLNSGDAFCGSTVLEALQESGAEADIICGNAIILEEPPRRKIAPGEITLRTLFNGSICHQAALISTRLLKEENYDSSLKIVADRKFFLSQLVLKGCSYQAVDVDIVDYDITGYSARNRLASEQEWQKVLAEMLPERILLDYGRGTSGALYGNGAYERFFLETGRRNWRRPIYRMVRGALSLLGIIVPAARFARQFPKQTD